MIKWKETIDISWKNIIKKIQLGYPCSSEKTLVFLLACEIKKTIADDDLIIDFESKPYQKLTDSLSKEKNTFLDLLIYKNENYKIAIEVKFPLNTNGNSNQTQTRQKIYRDIYRLEYLINEDINHIKEGYFLMIINEDAYLNKGTYKSNYHTYHNFSLKDYQPSTGEYVILQTNTFIYEGIQLKQKKIIRQNDYAYLKPLKINIQETKK